MGHSGGAARDVRTQPRALLQRPRMTLRTVIREIKDFPATAVFSLAWIIVFAAMVALRMQENPSPTWWRLLVLGIGDGHRFGDLTLQDLANGQYWRLVTSTFVHYNVIHIVLN